MLLPGDPGRALLLAQTLLDAPAMFNHHRGLWGYTGTAADGEPLTVQSTGMGGPSAAIVVSELAELGARRIVRVGTCGGLDDALALGELLIVTDALPEDGASRALGASGPVGPDPALLQALRSAGASEAHAGRVVSTDLFYDVEESAEQRWREAGALAVEMETATLFALARRRNLEAASLLIVSDLLASHARIEAEVLKVAEARLGEVATRALS